jgi:hypothetical protein
MYLLSILGQFRDKIRGKSIHKKNSNKIHAENSHLPIRALVGSATMARYSCYLLGGSGLCRLSALPALSYQVAIFQRVFLGLKFH